MSDRRDHHPVPPDYPAFRGLAADAHAHLLGIGKSVDATGLDKRLTELVKLRVSQLNGCAFCTALHANIARKAGVPQVQLDLLAAWRDAGEFSPRDVAALAWAEHLTRMAQAPIPDDAYAALREQFSEEEAVQLTVTIGTINAWNRIAGSLRFPASQGKL
ncbi:MULTISPECIES: carboxymuconolactone decarboxylase family protein [unclassified Cupriavidus]|uniref:carboxymuconolactone decarboxylase family protein n=1 Tax=unclassified Cupriavidus TaxID=2640874 RepID=UPI00029119F3|nr:MULTISPECIES: carboxymuconolactone decarboxylase family protein [unclassified Cupriavidus]ESJ20171.1 alkylhydroperoxidase [Cupriavidus sp. HPC(L)]MCD9123422.1 carboxymuconolactone decarboxylase family protein [Cupriavidus sp. UGS-1]